MTDPTHGQDGQGAGLRCPTCDSPEPRLHPAIQAEGEVSHICPDAWHGDDPAEPEHINAVLTLTDPNGRRWLVGAHLGHLVAEDDTDTTMRVTDMLDTALTLVSFKVVHHG